ncbi:MAG: D-tyrosyl-tRNA(Tyr) deacylase [Acidimicrobiaceae bacterium TMED130]|nr:MAG: D-tyrosyl-tRNA(Tyr) deacylase [Acidimicrobiaceae bacterium TMED130]
MRALVQRVSEASVEVEGSVVGAISKGLLIFIGITHSDSKEVAKKLANKITGLRIFEDQNGQMNFSTKDVSGEFLVVSQFTLYGNVDSGRRPGWTEAARPEQAEPLIEYFIECLEACGLKVETGIFQADMDVQLINQGPATLLIEVN